MVASLLLITEVDATCLCLKSHSWENEEEFMPDVLDKHSYTVIVTDLVVID